MKHVAIGIVVLVIAVLLGIPAFWLAKGTVSGYFCSSSTLANALVAASGYCVYLIWDRLKKSHTDK